MGRVGGPEGHVHAGVLCCGAGACNKPVQHDLSLTRRSLQPAQRHECSRGGKQAMNHTPTCTTTLPAGPDRHARQVNCCPIECSQVR